MHLQIRTSFGFMKIIKKFNYLISFSIFSFLLCNQIDDYISKALRDSIDLNNLNLFLSQNENSEKPEYIFLDALIEFNGDTATAKYKKYYSKFPQHKYADHAVYEIGSYYYSKGYYINSSSWFKKIPMFYRKSSLLETSIEMFNNSMIISGYIDSVSYYNNIFKKLYPNLNFKSYTVSTPLEIKYDNDIKKNTKFAIQIGAFEEYDRAESRMYMLRSAGFSVRIVEEIRSGKNYYLIREGEYTSKKSANKILMRIKARTGLKPIIIEI